MPNGFTDDDRAILQKYGDQFTDDDKAILSKYGLSFGKVVAPEGMLPGGKSTAAWESNSPLQKLGLVSGGAPIPKTGEEPTPVEPKVNDLAAFVGPPTTAAGWLSKGDAAIQGLADSPRTAKAFSQIYGAGDDIRGLLSTGSEYASKAGEAAKGLLEGTGRMVRRVAPYALLGYGFRHMRD